MKAYVGQTRKAALVSRLESDGIGECVVRGELPPRRSSWFYDNGAFGDWRAGRTFNYLRWSRDMRAIRLWADAEGIPAYRPRGGESMSPPDFNILPDLVAAGPASLAFSLEHVEEAAAAGAPLFVAVQDGMTELDVVAFLAAAPATIAGIFVGGSLRWKLETASSWVEFAHARGMAVHVGRVGTIDRVRWARQIGADSIDSAFPLWTSARLEAFVAEVTR